MRFLPVAPRFVATLFLMPAPLAFAASDYTPPSSDPRHLHVFDGYVYFSADDGIHGRELWRTDAAGEAELIADITPGPEGTEINGFSAGGDALFFRADPSGGESELWRTDGSPEGTQHLQQFAGGAGFGGVIGDLSDGRVLFRVLSESAALWASDGTEAGTQPFPVSLPDASEVTLDYYALIHNGQLYFSGSHPVDGAGFYRYSLADGQVERLIALAPESAGVPARMDAPATNVIALDSRRILFRGHAIMYGEELFVTEGSAGSTRLLADITPGSASSTPSEFTLIASASGPPLVLFAAHDGTHGIEPWITDGTPEGTRMLADIMPGPESARPYGFVVQGDRATFVATGPGTGKEIWSSARPFETVEMMGDINPGAPGSDPYALCALSDNKVVFSALDPVRGEELFRADPSKRQLRILPDIYPGPSSAYPYYTVALGDRAIFAATDPVHGRELWYANADGDIGLLADLYTDGSVNPSSSPRQLTPVGTRLFFVANDIAHGAELWVSDGSGAGTRLVKDIFPGRASGAPQALTPVGDLLYFTAEDGVHGVRLWRSDGSPEGTMAADLEASNPLHLTVVGPVLFFSAARAEDGRELWSTAPDGSVARVADIAPGAASSNPQALAAFQGALYFVADDGVHGEELWRSDGTAAGTVMVRDLIPVPYEALRFEAMAAGAGGLFLAGGSPSLGTELWQLGPGDRHLAPLKDIALRP